MTGRLDGCLVTNDDLLQSLTGQVGVFLTESVAAVVFDDFEGDPGLEAGKVSGVEGGLIVTFVCEGPNAGFARFTRPRDPENPVLAVLLLFR